MASSSLFLGWAVWLGIGTAWRHSFAPPGTKSLQSICLATTGAPVSRYMPTSSSERLRNETTLFS
ncbi:hypothetical protein V1278_000159 [Bradyrhizobium sp. AZCC 1577]